MFWVIFTLIVCRSLLLKFIAFRNKSSSPGTHTHTHTEQVKDIDKCWWKEVSCIYNKLFSFATNVVRRRRKKSHTQNQPSHLNEDCRKVFRNPVTFSYIFFFAIVFISHTHLNAVFIMITLVSLSQTEPFRYHAHSFVVVVMMVRFWIGSCYNFVGLCFFSACIFTQCLTFRSTCMV